MEDYFYHFLTLNGKNKTGLLKFPSPSDSFQRLRERQQTRWTHLAPGRTSAGASSDTGRCTLNQRDFESLISKLDFTLSSQLNGDSRSPGRPRAPPGAALHPDGAAPGGSRSTRTCPIKVTLEDSEERSEVKSPSDWALKQPTFDLPKHLGVAHRWKERWKRGC